MWWTVTPVSTGRLLERIAVDSFLDGWINEGAAAVQLHDRAERADDPGDRLTLLQVAADEERHAQLARDIVVWCHRQAPARVGRALARVS